jgi:hypothetical protein
MTINPDVELSYNLSESEKEKALAKAFWAIVECYGFSLDVVARLLYMSPDNRSPLNKLKEKSEFPKKPFAAIQNTAQLLGIHKNLGILFPEVTTNSDNAKLKYGWFKVPMKTYGGKSPIDFLKEGSENEILDRLKVIRRNLDIQRAC